ncbi:SET domain-containing protein SmydA-8-like [Musca vetustissima]|uniref:SET domain-containing protein SmydA-8-like n=1 Tax=Musca vetustissima TaxID=27455 RepID=UPI002AB751E8|nr:SET domain-containing protein SmydA-8-like [Musca vetustissima]
MADQFVEKCTVLKNEIVGRYVKSVEAIEAGETLLLEKPLLILPASGDKRCCNCFRYAQQYCSKCQLSPLCLECESHSEFDCKTLSDIFSKSPEVQVELLKKFFGTYNIIKCLLLYENSTTREYFEKMLLMESHLDKRRNTTIWKDHNRAVIQPLLKSNICQHLAISQRINEEFLQHICGIWDVNSYEIRAPDSEAMRALYLNASLLAHNCIPNANQAIDEQYRIKIYANRDIDKDEMITISYTNVLMGTDDRRNFLREGKYFHCVCARCEDPTELGSHMSTLICNKCATNKQEGFIMKIDAKTWKCSNCHHCLKNEQVETILEKVKEEVFHAQDDIRHLEYLLTKLPTLLHKNHYIIVDVKQNIASMLRSIIRNSLQRPGRQLYERKIRLCQELVVLLHIIQPGISRLKAIALYEMAIASAELYRLKFGEDEINAEELQEYLRKCEAMYRESMRLLLYEPPETPEGQLVKSIINELRDLRSDIQLLDNPLPDQGGDE